MTTEYLVIVEKASTNWSVYAPDLLGCVATGDSREEALDLMLEAMQMHIAGLQQDGLPIPPASTGAAYVEVTDRG